MALKPKDFDDILRVGRDIERMQSDYADVVRATQRAADQMKDLIDPPALRWLGEMHDMTHVTGMLDMNVAKVSQPGGV